MGKDYCEKVRISAIAIVEGEAPQLSAREVQEHLASCADCRGELEQQKQVVELLSKERLRDFSDDLCPRIAAGIERAALEPERLGQPVVVTILVVFLLACRTIEVLPAVSPGVAVKLIPVAVVTAFFILVRQNPFKVSRNIGFIGGII